MPIKRRVCVIGAGTAGLCAIKHALEHGMEPTAYEKSDQIGGTWVYEEPSANTEKEIEVGDDVHSSMYENLRTNLPKEVMGYPDFPYPESWEQSYIGSADVLNFLQMYTANFQLGEYIKFEHEIIRVRPRKDKWEVYALDSKNDSYKVAYYDFVFVCNGHYTTPRYPKIEGMHIYGGKQLHSHLYRKADMFSAATVLIIGGGPSGLDITRQVAKMAKRIYYSHHMKQHPCTEFMTNVIQKPDVARFTETGAIFADGSSENFSYVIHCTGYKYTFPFLSVDCGIHVEDNYVQPLYKHCININRPTMVLIGIPLKVCPTQLFDLQVRFAFKYYSGQQKLPSREEMLTDTEREMAERWASGLKQRLAHEMGLRQFDYYRNLAETANIERIQPVIEKMMKDCSGKYRFELEAYQTKRYKVVSHDSYIEIE